MPSFNEILVRADDETLQTLVGVHAVRLLTALDPQLATPSKLRHICLQLHSPIKLLRDSETRTLLCQLLRTQEAINLANLLECHDNSYTALEAISIPRNSAKEQVLFEFFQIIKPQKSPSYEIPSIQKIQPKYSLFEHQRHAHINVLKLLGTSDPRLILHMPTGAGKTRTAMHAVAQKLRDAAPTVVVWLAHSEELCDQAVVEFEMAWTYMGDRKLDVYRFWGPASHLDIQSIYDGFMVASLAKAYERAKRDGDFISRLADRTSLVVIDEAHQAIAPTYTFLLEYLVERKTSTGLLGLTATPGRTWNDPETDRAISEFFRGNKVTLKVPGYDNPVDYLISQGYLAKPNFRQLPYNPNSRMTDAQISKLSTSLDIPETILQALGEDDQRNMLLINTIEEVLSRHSRLLFFAATVDHANLISTVLQARNIDAASITAMTPQIERHEIIARFRTPGQPSMVLCNFGVLTTGFDAPNTSAAIIARPTKSLVLYSQMVGRATRGPLAGGNLEAEIVTIVDSDLPGFSSIPEMFNNWEDIWNE